MSDTQAPLLRDLITIPERVHQGDFVLKLSEGVSDAHADETVNELRRHRPTAPRVRRRVRVSSSARPKNAKAQPATCTARSAPAKATSWRC